MEPVKYDRMELMSIAKACRVVFDRCAAESPDLFGYSLLDLVADNIPDVPLQELKSAIICAGIYANAVPRIQREIAAYR